MTDTEATATARPKRRKDDREYHGMVRRMIRAYARRVDKGDVTTLARFVELRAEVDQQITEAARALHDQGFSWTEIAKELGITRQAARQRYAGLSRDAA